MNTSVILPAPLIDCYLLQELFCENRPSTEHEISVETVDPLFFVLMSEY